MIFKPCLDGLILSSFEIDPRTEREFSKWCGCWGADLKRLAQHNSLMRVRAVVYTTAFLIALTQICSVAMVHALETLESIQLRGTSKAESAAEAAREIQSKEISGLARELTRAMIGDRRFQSQRSLIESRIIKEANRFFPFVQPELPKKQQDGTWLMSVSVQYSAEGLRQMLVEMGLFNSSDIAPLLLSLVTFTDRDLGQTIRWWSSTKELDSYSEPLRQVWKSWSSSLAEQLIKQGFLALQPNLVSVPGYFPPQLRSEPDSPAHLRHLAAWTGAALVLRGEILVSPSESNAIQIEIEILSAFNGKLVSRFSRSVGPGLTVTARQKSVADAAKDFALLVFDGWSKGRFAVNTYRVVVRGTDTPQQVAVCKSELLSQLKDVREIRERFFEPGQVTFELDTGFGVESLKNRLGQLSSASKLNFKLIQGPSRTETDLASKRLDPFILDVRFQ